MKMWKYLPLLLVLGLAPAARCEDKLVQKVYSVADLVIPIDTANMRACAKPECCPADEVQNPTVYAKHLMKLLNMVKPESWEACGGSGKVEYFAIGHALVVQQTPEVQQQVAELLNSLRKLQDTQVVLEVRFVRQSPEFPERIGCDALTQKASQTIIWNDKQVRTFLEAAQGDRRTNIMQAPKLTVFNGQTANVEVGETKHFVTGMKVEECKGRKLYIPVNEQFFLGTRCEVQAVAKENGKEVALRFKATIAEEAGPAALQPMTSLVEPVAPSPANAKPVPFTQYLQKPNIEKIEVARTATIPVNATLVLPAGSFTKVACCEQSVPVLSRVPYVNRMFKTVSQTNVTENIVILVTPRIIVAEEVPAAPPAAVGELEKWADGQWALQPIPQARFTDTATLPWPTYPPQVRVRETRTGSFMIGSGCNSSSGVCGTICGPAPALVERYYPGGFHSLHGMSFRGAGQEMRTANTCGNIPWLNSIEYQCPVMANDMRYFVTFLDKGTVETPVCCQSYIDSAKPMHTVVKLRNVAAADVATALQGFFTDKLVPVTCGPQGDCKVVRPAQSCVIVAEPVSNCILIGASAEWMPKVLTMVERLDMPQSQTTSVCATGSSCCQTKSATMGLADVVALSSSGVSDEVIGLQIETTGATFTLCTEDILFLKKNHVSDRVVMKMQMARPKQLTAVHPQPVTMPFPGSVYPPAPYLMPPPAPSAVYPTPVSTTSPRPVPIYPTTFSVPVRVNGATPPLPPPMPMLYRRTIGPDGFERIGIDFGSPTPSAPPLNVLPNPIGPKPVSLDFGFPYPLTGVTGNITTNERNLDLKRTQSKQAGEVGEMLIGLTSAVVSEVATFVGEELPEILSEVGENLRPEVKVTVAVKFGSKSKYDSDPNVRMKQLLSDSENLRQIRDIKARFWGPNESSGLSYERLNGAIGP